MMKMNDMDIINENGVTEPVSSDELQNEMQMQCDEAEADPIENVRSEEADPVPPAQGTEAVEEVGASAEAPSKVGLLQAEFDALSQAFPGELPFTHLADMPRLGAFLMLREKGLTPREAYLAIEGERGQAVQSVSHLRAAAPRVTVPAVPTLLSHETLEEWRRLFPHLSDQEIGALYRRTAPNR